MVNRVETMDISLKIIEIDRRGSEGLICCDNIRADIKVAFFVRVNKSVEDVIKVAQTIGCERASDRGTMEELFSGKFSEALKTVGKQLDFVDLYTQREQFRDQIIKVIGRDLNGYFLEDAAIDYLEQTPIEALDDKNILDAQGIRKITELTTLQNVETNDLRQTERKAIKKQDVVATEAVLALERQEADARNKQEREIATMKAREEAETLMGLAGLGPAKSASLVAACEIGRRLATRRLEVGARIHGPADVHRHFFERLRDCESEHFHALLLDGRHRVMGEVLVSQGTLTASLVHPRAVFRAAIRRCAAALVLVHNHPSGDPEPSDEDRQVTERLVRAGEVLGIRVLDHVVVAERGYHSFREAGAL